MPRVTAVLAAGTYDAADIADSVILTRAQRQATHATFTAVRGANIELDLQSPAMLAMGDALVLENGRLIEVVAEAEPLLEVREADIGRLARLAWQLGDRHIPVQILPKRVRMGRDPTAEALLRRLGAKPVAIEAPFEPEGGAYRMAAHPLRHGDQGDAHHHDYDCDHDHDHGHHHHERAAESSKPE